ncbi:MAG: nickel pincer cofactor biosynthesis protein LarB [Ktedonobacteraceae bacterium]
MDYRADEQLELLGQLLNSEQFRQSSFTTQQGQSTPLLEIRPDPGRERRKGIPEVILGETKTNEQILAMARGLLAGSGRAIISRMCPESIVVVREAFHEYPIRMREVARAMVIYAPEYVRRTTGGHVGVISAGTSDIPVAEEAALIAEEMGCTITAIYDVGVAGLHRLLAPLRDLLATGVDVIIVAAGMDGALPSVVAGLVPVPVIGLPTSIGYGMGGKGVAALLSMLQTCAPGLSVVNIDNGVGAGGTAALIANRVALARREHQSQ